jgi:hypothetical protein
MKYIVGLLALFLTTFTMNAQVMGKQIMLKGKVVDVNTNQPLSIEVEFKPSTGRKFVVKSLEKTGTFEQLLQAGETYEVTFKGDKVYRETIDYTPKANSSEEYSEISDVFKVKGLSVGTVVEDLDIFSPKSTDLTAAGKKAIDKMKIAMRFNRTASFTFQVGAPSKSLAENRLKTLKDYIADWKRLLDRVDFQTSTKGNDLVIKISKVEDIFK